MTELGLRRKGSLMIVSLVLTSLVLACSARVTQPSLSQDGAAKKQPAICGNSSIAGVISLKGGAPWGLIDMSSDPFCVEANESERNSDLGRAKNRTQTVVVNDRWKLANVMVFLKGTQIDSCENSCLPEGQLFEHRDCFLVPRVLGVQKDQFLTLTNVDKTQHEYCVSPANNPSWCVSLKPGETNTQKKFEAAERFIQVSCSLHPWERAYVAVFNHQFFSVTNGDGRYEIKGVPPGEYTVVAWHEYYGERSLKVTIGPEESKTVNFTIDEMIPAEKLAKPLIEKSENEMLESAIRKIEPVYPQQAGRFRQDGKVEVRVVLDEEGNVTETYCLAGYPLLQDNAMVAARDWKFKPSIRNGVPVKVIGSIIFDFKIPDNLKLPSSTHYEMLPSDEVNQFFGPLSRPFSITLTLRNKDWTSNEPLIADLQFKNTIDKIVLLDLKGRYYFTGHLTDKRNRTYEVLWDMTGSGAKLAKEDYTELPPGGTYKLTLRSTRISDARHLSEKFPWADRVVGTYKLAIFYLSNSDKPLLPGLWVGQAMSNEVKLNVR